VGKKVLFELAYLVPEKAAGLINQADKRIGRHFRRSRLKGIMVYHGIYADDRTAAKI
jgi:hypothetical protein